MFAVLLTLGVATLTLLHRQNETIMKVPHGISGYGHPTDMLGPNGLHTTDEGRLIECGETAEAAKANDYPFDRFAFSYVPPACFEEDLMKEALNADSYLAPWAAGQFPWYLWSNFTDPLPQTAEELSKHKSLWTNNAWHKAHCLYEWRLMARAMHRVAKSVKPVYVLKRALEIAHVNHCNQMVSDPLTRDESPIWAMRSVGRCIRLDKFVDDWEEPELNF
jgi:hypothetical protein